MLDRDTFLTILYVMCDDYCKTHLAPETGRTGRKASLSRSEVIALAIYGQWSVFRNQRDFYRQSQKFLRAAFPCLPSRPQLNRLIRTHQSVITAFFLYLADCLAARQSVYEVLDTTGVPVRNAKRRGCGWLAGQANVSWCTRLGWFDGFRLLISANSQGALTGFGCGSASAKEQPLAEVFLGLRKFPQPGFESVGKPANGYYLTDKGFAGRKNHQRWKEWYGAQVICEPQSHAQPWPRGWQRWLRHYRQIVETVYAWLMVFFRLTQERPHALSGFQANLAAKMALHNFCIWLNRQFNRPALAFADLLDW